MPMTVANMTGAANNTLDMAGSTTCEWVQKQVAAAGHAHTCTFATHTHTHECPHVNMN